MNIQYKQLYFDMLTTYESIGHCHKKLCRVFPFCMDNTIYL